MRICENLTPELMKVYFLVIHQEKNITDATIQHYTKS
jgi:hypothetical protein